MKVFNNPGRHIWQEIVKRPAMDIAPLFSKVQSIMEKVKLEGDAALRYFGEQFDGVAPELLGVSQAEIEAAASLVTPELKAAIAVAIKNITAFHEAQQETVENIETMPGVVCWRKAVAIEKVGVYIPGGTAPLFSTVLMLAIPAKLAGCTQVVLCTPPQKDGSVPPAILYAASQTGVTEIIKVGGAQAIAAFTYGTESVPRVHKIFGPGNQFVTAAKQIAQMQGVAIDMPAGPSEVCVMADDTAVPDFVAADLLSQAEHGPDSQVLLVATSAGLIENVKMAIKHQLDELPRREIASKALENSRAVVLKDIGLMIELVNLYAPEHLIISMKDAGNILGSIVNAGSVFLGNYSPESVGDYASGTNHTLPTNGFAAMYSGVSTDSFVKKITIQELSATGLENISSAVIAMAEAEGLQAHARAVEIRRQKA